MSYFYDIRFLEGSHFLNSSNLKDSFHESKDMIVSSKQFKTFEDAEGSLSPTLNNFADIEERGQGCEHVIVTRVNPNFSGQRAEKDTSWDDLTVCRMYVASAEELRSSKIVYTVFAEIKCTDPDDINALR
jgi:hypothetical protein